MQSIYFEYYETLIQWRYIQIQIQIQRLYLKLGCWLKKTQANQEKSVILGGVLSPKNTLTDTRLPELAIKFCMRRIDMHKIYSTWQIRAGNL